MSHFLCGVAVPPSSPSEKPTKFYSFCKVWYDMVLQDMLWCVVICYGIFRLEQDIP